jgi:hypothetical protein
MLKQMARIFSIAVFGMLSMALLMPGCAVSQDSKTPAVLPAPSPGKAIVCIYRVGRFTGSAAHDELYVNDVHLAKLLNGEYAFTEVPPGTVVINGLPKMYTVDVFTAAGAAVNAATRKENERARFEAEAGTTYYLKWTSGTMATGIKVAAVDPLVGAKEMTRLHLSKPPVEPDATKPDAADAGKPAAK